MHILLTDILTCPRCGPQHGLILLADQVENRRVHAGVLGCANCRTQYPVREGAVEFGGATLLPEPADPEDAAVTRTAALLGITHGPGYVLLVGPVAAQAHGLAELLPDVEILASPYDAPAAGRATARGRVNRLGIGTRLPIATARVLGVALSGTSAADLLEEGVRVTAPVGRLLLEDAPADAGERLVRSGARVLAHEGNTVLAART